MAILPSIRKLLISHKNDGNPNDPVPFKDYGDDMRFLEIWASQPIQQLVAGANITLTPSSGLATDSRGNGPNPITIAATGGGGGGYASLTGPGETVTPGALTQAGAFTINDGSTTMGVSSTSITGNATTTVQFNAGVSFIAAGSSGGATMSISGGGGSGAHVVVAVLGGVNIVSTNSQDVSLGADNLVVTSGRFGTQIEQGGGAVGFYGATPQTLITITGSRGGNAALASLLTALDTLGLIFDSTSP